MTVKAQLNRVVLSTRGPGSARSPALRGALRNDWVTQVSAALSGPRRRTRAGPTFRLSAALPAATDTEESRVHQLASPRTRPAPADGAVTPSALPAPLCTGAL